MSEIVKGGSNAISMTPTGSKVFPNNFKLLEIWFRSIYGHCKYYVHTEDYFREMSESEHCQIDRRGYNNNDIYFPDIFAETLSNCDLIILKNTVHNIPDNFNLMKNLTCLHLVNCAGVTYIDKKYINGKYMGQNKYIINRSLISEIPDCLCELTQLRELWITDASIEEINPNIYKLINLELLDLCGNFIEDVPGEIYDLSNLTCLYLEDNKISDSKLYFIGVKLMFNIKFKKIINN